MAKKTKMIIAAPEESEHFESTVDIRGAKLKDNFCNYNYELIEGLTAGDTISRNGSSIIHEDMTAAFAKLNPHLGVICEELEAGMIQDIDRIAAFDDEVHTEGSLEHRVSKFKVSLFKLSGSGDNESVVLNGTKMLSTGEFVELKTPSVRWEGEYHFIDDLRVAIDDLKIEVEKYMNGKTAPKLVQQEMGFEENEPEEV